MPGESETNGQVPQLKIQNEDNETVLIQNGTPKKVRELLNCIIVMILNVCMT